MVENLHENLLGRLAINELGLIARIGNMEDEAKSPITEGEVWPEL
jgi:hypothetical protein